MLYRVTRCTSCGTVSSAAAAGAASPASRIASSTSRRARSTASRTCSETPGGSSIVTPELADAAVEGAAADAAPSRRGTTRTPCSSIVISMAATTPFRAARPVSSAGDDFGGGRDAVSST